MATNFPAALDTTLSLYNIADVYSPTTITTAVGVTDTTINVKSTVGYPLANGLIVIGTEQIRYSSSTITSFVGCVRALNGTVNVSHDVGTTVQSIVTGSAYTNLRDAALQIEAIFGVNGQNVPLLNAAANVFTGTLQSTSLNLAANNGFGLDQWSLSTSSDGTTATLTVGYTGSATNNLISISKITALNGTAVAPSYSFASHPGSGIYNVSGTISFAVSGALKAFINGNINLATNSGMYTLGASNDTSFCRISASTVGVGNGTAGDTSGNISATLYQTSGSFTPSLASSYGGAFALASGGASPVSARFLFGDGSAWTLRFAKRTGSVTTDLMGFIDTGVFGFLNAGSFDSSLSRTAAGVIAAGNGTAADTSGTFAAARFLFAGSDAALTRTASATVAVGNGTAGDFSGTLKCGNEIVSTATPTVAAGQVGFGNSTAGTATAGAGTLPANPDGFLIINVAGTTKKIPYYQN
jgi:hypothetical protein